MVSNFLDTDSQDKITGIKGEVIHCYNKNETVIKHTEYYEMVKDRSNVILMGDNLGNGISLIHCIYFFITNITDISTFGNNLPAH